MTCLKVVLQQEHIKKKTLNITRRLQNSCGKTVFEEYKQLDKPNETYLNSFKARCSESHGLKTINKIIKLRNYKEIFYK